MPLQIMDLNLVVAPDEEPAVAETVEALRYRERHFRSWRLETRDIDALVSHRWHEVFPKDIREHELPMIANLPRITVEDGGRLFREARPMEVVDPPSNKEPARKKAELREQALNAYSARSGIYQGTYEMFGQDFVAAGLVGIKTWPEKGQPMEKRFPRQTRLDPRSILPEPGWRPDRPTDNVIVVSRRPIHEVAGEFEGEARQWLESLVTPHANAAAFGHNVPIVGRRDDGQTALPGEVEIIDFLSTRHVTRIALARHQWAGDAKAKVLYSMENDTKICPVQLGARISWGLQPQSQVYDSKGVLQAQNRYFSLLMAQFTRMVYAPVLAWNIRNPNAKGPDAVLHALGPDAKYEKLTPDNPAFHVFQLLGMLDDFTRTGMVAPRAREGEVDLNKATAAFLTRATSQLASVTRSHHDQFAAVKEDANEAAFAQDEAWCDASKEITGRARGRRFVAKYRPSRDIKGDHSNRVVYGTASGVDTPTHQILMLNKHAQGLMADEDFFEADPTVEDVTTALNRMRAQRMERGILAALEDPQMTPLIEKLAAWRAFKDHDDFDKVIEELLQLELEAAGAGPGGGGLPGEEGGPPMGPPGVAEAEAAGLPPMAELEEMMRGGL